MPSQYFGNSVVNRYFPEGDANLESPPSAYGETHAVSHGTEIGNNMMGPDLGPHHREIEHSGMLTGGKRNRRRQRRRRQSRRQNKKNSRQNRRQNRRQNKKNSKQNRQNRR